MTSNSTDRTLTLLAVGLMLTFHLFIIGAFALAVPQEWNLQFMYTTIFLFAGIPAQSGYGVGDMSSIGLTPAIVAGLLFFPVLGNLRPDLVSFPPSMRQYAGNSIIGFNFGDGHLHGPDLLNAIQKRCGFAPGEFLVAWVESQPIHKKTQAHQLIEVATGVVERGTRRVADAVGEQPWLPNGPIPMRVTWSRERDGMPA
jgi:hypothetical protein